MTSGVSPIIDARGLGKSYGPVRALAGVSCEIRPGEVTAILGDNGAGKSTLISLLSGMQAPDTGELRVDGRPVVFSSPQDARELGIETVYQDLALAPLMPVWRNFFLGRELTRFGMIRTRQSRETAVAALAEFGIQLRDADQPVGTLSGGERQCVAIARAVHFGARVLILDEPTAALGVRQSAIVLRQIAAARERGLAVLLITHNPSHAYAVGDHFVLLQRGGVAARFSRDEINVEALARHMAGGHELDALTEELDAGRHRRQAKPTERQ